MSKICSRLNRKRSCKKCKGDFTVRWDASPQTFCSRLCAKEEAYLKIGLSLKGRVSQFKGVPRSKETVEKIRLANLGRKVSPESRLKMSLAKIGKPSPRKGCKMSDEVRRQMSISRIGRIPPNKGKKSKYCGELHHGWKGGVTPTNEKIRKSMEYRLWRTSVFVRDDYTCQICALRGGELHADHIKPFAYFPELRFAIDNGRTLCVSCHRKTDTYGHNAVKNK